MANDETNSTPTAEDFPVEDPKIRVVALQEQLNAAEAVANKIRDELHSVQRQIAKEQIKQVPLHVLNQQAREATRVESNRRVRAQEAFDRMANHYVPGRKPHPTLFETPEKPEKE